MDVREALNRILQGVPVKDVIEAAVASRRGLLTGILSGAQKAHRTAAKAKSVKSAADVLTKPMTRRVFTKKVGKAAAKYSMRRYLK